MRNKRVGTKGVCASRAYSIKLSLLLGNCDIDFFNFRHYQVQNFEILNRSEKDQNFVVNFQKNQKHTQELISTSKLNDSRQCIIT